MRLLAAALVPVGLAPLACDLDLDFTSQGSAVTATANGDGSTEVSICAGPRDLLTCNGQERFVASMDGEEITPAAALLSFGVQYAFFDGDDPGVDITVERVSDGARAVAVLPRPFDLESTASGSVISLGDELTFRWTASEEGGTIQWKGVTNCQGTSSFRYGETDDDGEVTIAASKVFVSADDCSGVFSIARVRAGEMHGFEEDSEITAKQVRWLALSLRP